jgi:hypothetical protein
MVVVVASVTVVDARSLDAVEVGVVVVVTLW